MAEPEVHKQPELLHQLMLDEQITCLHFVPSMLSAFTHYLLAKQEKEQTVSHSVFSKSVKQVTSVL